MDSSAEPSELLLDFAGLLSPASLPGPVLDLACGSCRNGIYLAKKGLPVVCCDRSAEHLREAARLARAEGVDVALWQNDLEAETGEPLPWNHFGAILVFRYLHRPLIPRIREALRDGGILVYETFTEAQPQFGRPRNPAFLLKQGELLNWFQDWEIIHSFEGVKVRPTRAVAQLVCRKPGKGIA